MIRNPISRSPESVPIAVEIDQKRHEPVWIPIHVTHVVGNKTLDDLHPSADFFEHLDLSCEQKMIQQEAVRQLPVCVILW
jgi:hypothetical protein